MVQIQEAVSTLPELVINKLILQLFPTVSSLLPEVKHSRQYYNVCQHGLQ